MPKQQVIRVVLGEGAASNHFGDFMLGLYVLLCLMLLAGGLAVGIGMVLLKTEDHWIA